MKSTPRLTPRWFLLPAVLIGCILSTASLLAQSGSSIVQGRVYNPATKSYVGNAKVELDGTNQVTYTTSDGAYQFNSVPTGSATVSVSYTGYETAKESFTVSPGQTAVPEIDLTSSEFAGAKGDKDQTVQLAAMTVVSAREGNAKAIMNQRKNMNIVTSTSADMFGEIPDGNIGEFLKYLPGVTLDYVESEVRGPRLGGMDGQYTGVAVNGMRTANADANRGGGAQSRATSFEGFSIAAVDSVEINHTASPENDADSPAGAINLKTKSAFDLKGRRIDYKLGTSLDSDELTLGTQVHPGEKESHQFRPIGALTYAESFFDHKFGLLIGLSRSNTLAEQTAENISYDTGATVADPRKLVAYKLDFKDAPKWIQRDSLLLSADWKVFPHLKVGVSATYSFYNSDNLSRDLVFQAANSGSSTTNGRAVVGGDGLTTMIGTVTSGNPIPAVYWGGGSAAKRVWTRQFTPTFEYKHGPLTIDGSVGYSNSVNKYRGLAANKSASTVGGVPGSFVATRSDEQSWNWTIKQTSGNDWFNINNFVPPANANSANVQVGGTSIQDRTDYNKTEKWTEVLNVAYALPFMKRFPTVIKIGGKMDDEDRFADSKNNISKWVYVGPGGDTTAFNPATGTSSVTSYGNWGNLGTQYISPAPFRNYDTDRLSLTNINGVAGLPPFPNQLAISQLYNAHPELFVNTANVGDYYSALYGNARRFSQEIKATYAQADTRLTSKLSIRFGERIENTKTTVTDFNPLTPTQMLSSPFASQFTKDPLTGKVNPARATSVAGLIYQYTTQPKVKRTASYNNFFPSVVLKYSILTNLEWQAGLNKTISRPPIDQLAGVRSIDDNAVPPTVSIPNTALKPEHHKGFQTRLAYYFGGGSPGQISVALKQDEATNFISSHTYDSGAPLGITDPQFDGYQFKSSQNDPGVHRYRNFDFNYQQTLGFLPSVYLRGISLGFNYSRSYDNQRHGGLVPKHVAFTPSYTYRRFSARAGVIWNADTDRGNVGEYTGHQTKLDVGMSFKIDQRLQFYAQVRNLTNVKDKFYKTPAGLPQGEQAALTTMEVYGAACEFGIKGTF